MTIIANSLGSCTSSRSSLTINVPRQTSFRLNPGRYAASIRSVTPKTRQTANSSVPYVRLLLNVDVPDSRFDYLAKIDFKIDLKEGSDLWNVLARLIGRDRLTECSGGSFDLTSLQGTPCDVEIGHVHDDSGSYDFPLVVVSDVQARGRFVPIGEKDSH